MIRFEIWFNNVENSCKSFFTSENVHDINNTIFNAIYFNFEQNIETAIECASWAELATDGDVWENNDITIICHC